MFLHVCCVEVWDFNIVHGISFSFLLSLSLFSSVLIYDDNNNDVIVTELVCMCVLLIDT